MTVRVHRPDGFFKDVFMSQSTKIEAVLNDYTPSSLENTSPVITVHGRVTSPDMELGRFPANGDILSLTFQLPPAL